MTGLFGDEVLRQLRVFKPVEPCPDVFSPQALPYVRQAEATYSRLLGGNPLSFALFRQAPWYQYGNLALEQTQVSIRSPFLDNDFTRTVFRAPRSTCTNNDLRLRLIGDGNPALQRIRTDLGFGSGRGKVSAAASRGLLKFSFKAEYAYDYGMPQWASRADHFLSRLQLERLFLGRHKFTHYRVWYRDILAGYIQEMLLDPRTLSRPYLEPKALESMVRGHLHGGCNYTTTIHKLLTLELIHRLFIDA